MKRIASSFGAVLTAPVYRHGLRQDIVGAISRRCLHSGVPTKARTDRVQRVQQGQEKGLLSTLEERGLINQIAGDRDSLDKLLSSRRIAAYSGIDPTAPSLHLGHLVPLMILFWLHAFGHTTISLIGGATAQIGDPTGRLTSRNKVDGSVHQTNLESLMQQVRGLWDHAEKALASHRLNSYQTDGSREERGQQTQVKDNREWLNQLSIVDFLKFMGAGARMGTMLGRDTVRNKMTQGDGMSFAEFSYPLLQAWDWWHMYTTYGVQLQVGGSDQYGNIIAGMDAIRYMSEYHPDMNSFPHKVGTEMTGPVGLTVPLLTTASGAKFGKSAGNAVWLNKDMTSSFELYGFLLKSADADVERYLKLFTFLPTDRISAIMDEHASNPSRRQAQHLLAAEVLALVHGREEAEATAQQHRSMRRPSLQSLSQPKVDRDATLGSESASASFEGAAERVQLRSSQVRGCRMDHVLQNAGLVKSRGEGRRLVASGGVYVAIRPPDSQDIEFRAVPSPETTADEYLLDGSLLVVRMGKWKVKIIELVDH